MYRFLPILLLAIIGSAFGAGLYPPNSNVIQLDKNNFHQVFDSSHVWLVEFYAPWCGHCKTLAPAWEAAATNLKGVARVAAVNCDEHRELASMFDIKGFPTILFFGSEQAPNPHKAGLPWKTPETYQGGRTATAIANWAISKLPNFVATGAKSLDELFTKGNTKKVILFSDKPSPSNIYKGLAVDFKDRLSFAYVAKSNEKLVSQYGITSFPTLIVDTGNGEVTKFESEFNYDSLFNFLKTFVPAKEDKNRAPQAQEQDLPAEVVEITTAEEFEKRVLAKGGPIAVAFFDKSVPEDLEKYLATTLELAEKFKKQFRFTWVDGPSHLDFMSGLQLDSGFPQLVVLNPKKKVFAPLVGAYETRSITSFLDRVFAGSKRLIRQLDEIPPF